MASSTVDIKKKFFSKVGNDKVLSDFFALYLSSKPVGDDSLGQRFIITDKGLNDSAMTINESLYLDLGEHDGFVTYRFTIALLKKLGLELCLEMQENFFSLGTEKTLVFEVFKNSYF